MQPPGWPSGDTVGTGGRGRLDVVIDRERRIHEVTGERGPRSSRRCRAARAAASSGSDRSASDTRMGRRTGSSGWRDRAAHEQPVDPLPRSIQVVEAVVLLVDDDDVIDPSRRLAPLSSAAEYIATGTAPAIASVSDGTNRRRSMTVSPIFRNWSRGFRGGGELPPRSERGVVNGTTTRLNREVTSVLR